MKIVADENIPLVNELFGSLGTVATRAGRNITPEDVQNADVLLVRSVTRVNQALLGGSSVRFVGTCTIGTDHLDQDYLTERNIYYASAPGCNAYGVVQYVFAAMAQLGFLDCQKKIGIIGCGNVGGRLYRALKAAGFKCVCYDPFLSKTQIPDLQSWDSLFDCDIVCVHTPLTCAGDYPTYHMLGADFFSRMKAGALLLNAGRGEVVDNQALLAHFEAGNKNGLQVVLDVWEPEPDLNTDLLQWVSIATPHIAGYSFEGKVNGSLMIYEALANWLSLPSTQTQQRLQQMKQQVYGEPESLRADSIADAILATYAIKEDDAHLRAVQQNIKTEFDLLRKHYPQRREFRHYRLQATDSTQQHIFSALGFLQEGIL